MAIHRYRLRQGCAELRHRHWLRNCTNVEAAGPRLEPQPDYDDTGVLARVWRMLARPLCGGIEVTERTCADLSPDSSHSTVMPKPLLVLESGA